jgi:HlyD family secretion protein
VNRTRLQARRARCFPALAIVAAAACGSADAAEQTASTDVQPVVRATLDITAEAAGLMEPPRVIEVKSKASGEVLRMHVETGDIVERGALLAEIDPRDVRNGYAQADADLEVARARLSTAQAQHTRVSELREAGVVTEQELESAALELANANANFIKARTSLELARERLTDVTIRAPIDGVVIQKDVETGQIIASASQNISGGTTLLLMADISTMQVRTLVDETDIGRVQPGQTATVHVEAFPNRDFTGTVTKIEPQAVVDQNVTMFPVLVQLPNPDGALKPGMNAEVRVEIARRPDVLTVPNSAVVSPADAMAAAAVLGLDEDAMRGQFAGRRGAVGGGGPRPDGPVAAGDGGRSGSNGPAGNGGAARTGPNGPGQGAVADASAAAPSDERCRELMAKVRDEGRAALAEDERPDAGACFRRMRGAAGTTTPPGADDEEMAGVRPRPGVVFVQGADGPEPRFVMLGLNDWESTEVLRGVEEGEQVYLISVARLQQEQQELLDRIRSRSNPFGGGR